jgi:putative ATP-grasp target RiPP
MDSRTVTEDDRITRSTAAAPFGLRFARTPRAGVELDLDHVRYDERSQRSLVADGDRLLPLIDHRLAQTLQTSGESPREDEIFDKSFT